MIQGTRHRSVLSGLLVALFVAGLAITIMAQAPASNTIYACVNAAGIVRIIPPRAACLGGEQPIQWNITGPAGAGSLKVVDANGSTVGAFYAAPVPNSDIAVLEVNHTFVGVNVTRNGLYKVPPPLDPLFRYKDSQCAGTKYLRATNLMLRGVVDLDNVLYYPGPLEYQGPGGPQFWRKFPNPMGGFFCQPDADFGWIGEVQQYQLPAYTPPFTVAQ